MVLVSKHSCELYSLVFLQQQNLGRKFGAGKMHLSPPTHTHTRKLRLLSVLRRWLCCFWSMDYCLMYFPLFVDVPCLPLFWYALLYVLSSFAINLKRNRGLVASLLLSCGCLVTVKVLWLFVVVPWVGLQSVSVVFPDQTHFFKVVCLYKIIS